MATSLTLKMDSKTLHHELRTPLTGILGGINLLNCENMTSEQHEMIDIVKQSSTRLLDFINLLLSSYIQEDSNKALKPLLRDEEIESNNLSLNLFN